MVVVIDDEKSRIEGLLDEFRFNRVEYRVLHSIKSADSFFRTEKLDDVELVLLDIMMDGQKSILPDIDTEGGTTTGIHYLDKVITYVSKKKVCILTNYMKIDILRAVSNRTGVKFIFKPDLMSRENAVVDLLDEYHVKRVDFTGGRS